MAQTSYNDSLVAGVSGDLADGPDERQIQTYINATEDIPYGRAVAKIAADDDGIDLPSVVGDLIVGVSVRKQDDLVGCYDFDGTYGEPVAVLRKGAIYVKVEEDVTPDDDVYVRFEAEVHVSTITLNVDLVALNSVAGTINGTAITPVVWATTHDAQMTALAAELQTNALIATAAVTAARVITVIGATEALELAVVLTATLGVSQPTLTQADVSGPSDSDELGSFRTDDADTGDGAMAVALATAKFLTSASAGGVAQLDINLP